MIRPMGMRDSSLRSECHAERIFGVLNEKSPFFVILNELLGEEESLL
jgi:predicted xylose isomerase-like sugar epimerase